MLEKQAAGRRASERMQKEIEKHHAKIEKYEAFCKELGEKPADVGIAWLLHQPAVTAPIIGPRTSSQLEDSLHAMTIKLSPEQLKTLDEIFPVLDRRPIYKVTKVIELKLPTKTRRVDQ